MGLYKKERNKIIMCDHRNANITFYEISPTRYTLEDGEVDIEASEELENQHILKVDVSCPECGLDTSYPDWTKAPEPILFYCQMIYDREYGSVF